MRIVLCYTHTHMCARTHGPCACLLAQTASRDLVELLRINTVVRAVSNQLGVTMEERKRVFAWFARRGLPPCFVRAPHIHHKFNQVSVDGSRKGACTLAQRRPQFEGGEGQQLHKHTRAQASATRSAW